MGYLADIRPTINSAHDKVERFFFTFMQQAPSNRIRRSAFDCPRFNRSFNFY